MGISCKNIADHMFGYLAIVCILKLMAHHPNPEYVENLLKFILAGGSRTTSRSVAPPLHDSLNFESECKSPQVDRH